MAKICISCGLTTDADGNLIVASSGAAGDNAKYPVTATCTVTNGTHVYCDATTGKLYGEPEKFVRMRRFGKSLTPNSDQDLADLVDSFGGGADGNPTPIGTPIILGFTNPSPCRPMKFLIESGVSHGQVNSDAPGGSFVVQIGTELTIVGPTPASSLATAHTGHQIWAYDAVTPGINGGSTEQNVTFDSMGARAYSNEITIPPGASITITLQGYITLTLEDATANIRAFTIDLVYTAWND